MESSTHIQSLLDAGHKKALRDEIVEHVGRSKSRMADLMSFFFHDEWRYNQRSAWSVGIIGAAKPKLIAPYLKKMLDGLETATHPAVPRNTIKIFTEISIPEELEGILFDKCMSYLEDTKAPIAVRCYSINVLEKIADKYPELQADLVAVVKEHLPHGTAGIKYRCRRVIKKFG